MLFDISPEERELLIMAARNWDGWISSRGETATPQEEALLRALVDRLS